MAREDILSCIRSALADVRGSEAPPPPVWLHRGGAGHAEKFAAALSALAGHPALVGTLAEACAHVESVLAGRRAIASRAPILAAARITSLKGVNTEFSREACAAAEVGITSADFALADTGTLVMLTESGESRLISLLPPCHIAVIEGAKILESLDELFGIVPHPADQSSGMVLITGPSRTADIEMRLVRGVHGPGEIHIIIVGDVTSLASDASDET
jgi:L-lactate dehydrogenase complex protein LldG